MYRLIAVNFDNTNTGNKIAKSMASKTLWNISTSIGAIGNKLDLNNSSGFDALPGGLNNADGDPGQGHLAYFWSSSIKVDEYAYYRMLSNINYSLLKSYGRKWFGYSVRCVKD